MKAAPALLIIAVATIALAGGDSGKQSRPPLPTGTTVGRFQLIPALIDDAAGRPEAKRYLFRIDTATGQVWRYQHTMVSLDVPRHPEVKSMEAEGWIEVGEDILQSVEDAQRLMGSKTGAEKK